MTVDRRLTATVAEHVRGELASKIRRTAEDATRKVAVRVGQRVRDRLTDSLGK